MHQVSIEQAKTSLPDLVEAAVSGDEVCTKKSLSSCRFLERSRRRSSAARKD